MMTVLDTCLEPRAIANLEDFLARIGDQHDFALNDEHEFIFRHMPVSLAGPSARRQTQPIYPKIREFRRMPKALPHAVRTGGVERLRIPGPHVRGYTININSFRHDTPCRLNPTRETALYGRLSLGWAGKGNSVVAGRRLRRTIPALKGTEITHGFCHY